MKTCLYNSIFINPLAYYVFPQLYDIESKTDDFIESAIFTGFLEIDPVNKEGTKLIANTRSIDLSEFAGERIRISQYADVGSTILGEWVLPGQSEPEPELSYAVDFTELFGVEEGVSKAKITLNADHMYVSLATEIPAEEEIVIPSFMYTVDMQEGTYINIEWRNSAVSSENGYQIIEESGTYTLPEIKLHNPSVDSPQYVEFVISLLVYTSAAIITQLPLSTTEETNINK